MNEGRTEAHKLIRNQRSTRTLSLHTHTDKLSLSYTHTDVHTHMHTGALRLHPFIKVEQETSRWSASICTRANPSPLTSLHSIDDRCGTFVQTVPSVGLIKSALFIFFFKGKRGWWNWSTGTYVWATNWWGHVGVKAEEEEFERGIWRGGGLCKISADETEGFRVTSRRWIGMSLSHLYLFKRDSAC